ncbi:hypothetical protein Pint_26817 [Pistacia integerrima]|uniref:Uncharacterized protein n=1 Tax=Pistacia integerrima TaxID=434235 RepID=A0ACC0YQJ9_9ROSI|nr:hypothetical protein Pint_26817 [Pistacia integerrima]
MKILQLSWLHLFSTAPTIILGHVP